MNDDTKARSICHATDPTEQVDASLDAVEYQEISDEIKRIGDQLDEMLIRVNDFLDS